MGINDLSAAPVRPGRETDEPVYSNYDHELDAQVVTVLEGDPDICAQHAAWDFCGYIWRDGSGHWFNEVWRYHAPVEVIEGDGALDVVEAANERYGNG